MGIDTKRTNFNLPGQYEHHQSVRLDWSADIQGCVVKPDCHLGCCFICKRDDFNITFALISGKRKSNFSEHLQINLDRILIILSESRGHYLTGIDGNLIELSVYLIEHASLCLVFGDELTTGDFTIFSNYLRPLLIA